MQPISYLTTQQAREITVVMSDIDDTMTTHGKLPSIAYDALWKLKKAGIAIIPVTGRPAGWCDLIARQWPVNGVIGENGAVALYEQNGVLKEIQHPLISPQTEQKLAAIKTACLTEIIGCRVAKDQPYRRYDLAIDFAEEEPKLSLKHAAKIRAVFERFGAQAKISSIHVNGWFGDYNKLSMTQYLFSTALKHLCPSHKLRQQILYCGDSPNDAPMFAHFPLSIGVANVIPFVEAKQLEHPPQFVTQQHGGEGFAEMVDLLLKRKKEV